MTTLSIAMKTSCLILFLISSVAGLSSSLHSLSWYSNTTVPTPITVADGSNIYLTSSDHALPLSRITLTTRGQSITLDRLLSSVDDDGFQTGWPVYSDLTISTTNNENTTKALYGSLFVTTPSMAQDPNFFVYVVRKTRTLDRSVSDKSTIVFLNVHTVNNSNPTFAGFTHTRIEQITQPKTTGLYFYRGEPDDNYVDVNNSSTLNKLIFANPLQLPSTTDSSNNAVFFDNIDPIQYSLSLWHMTAIGGITLSISDAYVDTTSISCNSVTTTGMSNSQLFAYNSSVVFRSVANNLGSTGFVTTAELYSRSNLTFAFNSNSQSSALQVANSVNNDIHVVDWAADSLQIYPSNLIPGIYFVQYFKIDGGSPTTTPAITSVASSTPVSSSAPASSSSSTVPPSTTAQNIPTTTKSAATFHAILSLSLSSLYLVLRT